MSSDNHSTMPSGVDGHLSFFDRFATVATGFVSRAWFFALCVALVVIWLPSYFLFGTVDTWQLVINTITSIVTFLLVALLQNIQSRGEAAVQQKLNAIAEAMANMMTHLSENGERSLSKHDVAELRKAVGLEDKESS